MILKKIKQKIDIFAGNLEKMQVIFLLATKTISSIRECIKKDASRTVIICIKQKCWNIGWLFDYIKK